MYGDYMTTFEEYQAQRYEGASTIFGPNELEAFIHEALRLVKDMASGAKSASRPSPEVDLRKMINLLGECSVIFHCWCRLICCVVVDLWNTLF